MVTFSHQMNYPDHFRKLHNKRWRYFPQNSNLQHVIKPSIFAI